MVSFTPCRIAPWRNSLRYKLYRRLGGPLSRSGRYEEDKDTLSLPAIEPPDSSVTQPVAYSLYRQSIPTSGYTAMLIIKKQIPFMGHNCKEAINLISIPSAFQWKTRSAGNT
jgi:hypothetical protein